KKSLVPARERSARPRVAQAQMRPLRRITEPFGTVKVASVPIAFKQSSSRNFPYKGSDAQNQSLSVAALLARDRQREARRRGAQAPRRHRDSRCYIRSTLVLPAELMAGFNRAQSNQVAPAASGDKRGRDSAPRGAKSRSR